MNMGVQISFWVSVLFLLNIFPEVELLDCIVVLFIICEEPPYCFPQWLHQFTISPRQYTRVPFSPHLCQCMLSVFLIMAILWYEVISHCSFDLHFPNDVREWCWASFSVPVDYLYIVFRKMCIPDLLPTFIYLFLLLSWKSSLFWILIPYWIYD